MGDVPTAGAILDRFLHHAQFIAITGKSYRVKDATAAGENKKPRKPDEPSTAKPASYGSKTPAPLVFTSKRNRLNGESKML